jgi:hypothetical protein
MLYALYKKGESIMYCEQCGSEFKPSKSDEIFCGNLCHEAWTSQKKQQELDHKNTIGGIAEILSITYHSAKINSNM